MPKQKIVLKRYQDYHGTPPKADRIELYVIGDEGTAALSLQKGELDLCYLRVPDNIPTVRKDANLKLYFGPSATTKGFVAFNLENPILKDVRVRRAMVYALDRDLITETVGGEMATRAYGFLEPSSYWGALDFKNQPSYPYDPQKAKALLAEAGYPKGFSLTYTEINVKAHSDLARSCKPIGKKSGLIPKSNYSRFRNGWRAAKKVILTLQNILWAPGHPNPAYFYTQTSIHRRLGLD